MIKFDSDYLEGAHPQIMEALLKTNREQTSGYSEDEYCEQAKKIIKEKFELEDVDIHFITGGTLANLTVAAAALRPHQGIISPVTGHINVHETGAIEATGHKIISVLTEDGKITATDIEKIADEHVNDEVREHTVMPKMVYISNPTELGTVYSKDDIVQIREVCDRFGLLLYMDGARLGYALANEKNDTDIKFFTKMCDAFYIGGTKIGALFGEALIISNPSIKQDFRYIMKQRGGMLAKGRLLGIQFIEFFKDDLYFDISKHANECADMIKKALVQKGYPFLSESFTNQQFPIMPDEHIKKLSMKYSFSFWQKIDDSHSAIRFCTGWATTKEDAAALGEDILKL